jgi:hypothetical protein
LVLQLYVDESISHRRNRKAYVAAGYIASASAWADFSVEWEALLPLTRRGRSGKYRFKMSEMQAHMEKVPAFYEVIRRHALVAVSMTIFEDDFEAALARIWSDNTVLVINPVRELRYMVKTTIMEGIYNYLGRNTGNSTINKLGDRVEKALEGNFGQPLDIYFDNESGSDLLLEWWQEMSEEKKWLAPESVGGMPRFEDDEDFLPLQAADFWAWWVRKGEEDDTIQEIMDGKFGSWSSVDHVPVLRLYTKEDMLVETFINSFLANVSVRPVNIYDAKVKPITEHALAMHRPGNRSGFLRALEGALRRMGVR